MTKQECTQIAHQMWELGTLLNNSIECNCHDIESNILETAVLAAWTVYQYYEKMEN